MKHLLLAIAFLFTFSFLPAQSDFFLGFQGGPVIGHTDIPTTSAYHGGITVGFQPAKVVAIEAQFTTGNLRGQENLAVSPLRFNNRFNLITLRGNLFLDQLIEKDHGTGIHVFASAGAGLLLSQVKEVNTPPDGPAGELYEGSDLVIPAGLGLQFEVTPTTHFQCSWLYHVTLSDEINGYNPQVAGNSANDHFSLVSLGFRFFL